MPGRSEQQGAFRPGGLEQLVVYRPQPLPGQARSQRRTTSCRRTVQALGSNCWTRWSSARSTSSPRVAAGDRCHTRASTSAGTGVSSGKMARVSKRCLDALLSALRDTVKVAWTAWSRLVSVGGVEGGDPLVSEQPGHDLGRGGEVAGAAQLAAQAAVDEPASQRLAGHGLQRACRRLAAGKAGGQHPASLDRCHLIDVHPGGVLGHDLVEAGGHQPHAAPPRRRGTAPGRRPARRRRPPPAPGARPATRPNSGRRRPLYGARRRPVSIRWPRTRSSGRGGSGRPRPGGRAVWSRPGPGPA